MRLAIYDFSTEDNPHPSGALTIRVCVSIGGKVHQKYFEPGQMAAAKEAESKLLKKQAANQRKLRRTRPQVLGKAYTKTGVSGLRINIKKCRGRAGQLYYRCVIVMGVASDITHDGRAVKTFIVTKQTLTAQWYKACREVCKHKGISSVPKDWLDRCPKPSDFTQLIKHYQNDKLILDIGFKSLPAHTYPSAKANVMSGY